MNASARITAEDTVQIERLLPGPIETGLGLPDRVREARPLAGRRRHGASVRRPRRARLPQFRADRERQSRHRPMPVQAGEVTMIGRIVACTPPRLLSYRWGENDDASEVTFELTPKDDKVLLKVTHRRIPGRDAMLSISAGWHTHPGHPRRSPRRPRAGRSLGRRIPASKQNTDAVSPAGLRRRPGMAGAIADELRLCGRLRKWRGGSGEAGDRHLRCAGVTSTALTSGYSPSRIVTQRPGLSLDWRLRKT